jgi:hypothetical protein
VAELPSTKATIPNSIQHTKRRNNSSSVALLQYGYVLTRKRGHPPVSLPLCQSHMLDDGKFLLNLSQRLTVQSQTLAAHGYPAHC